ncbi:condensin complex non-SMC subunit Cnd2 [Schizosaccharomyces japonicus yFS275]|uniref:Condensin complex subunit 2 n=1 Tax=Schizosaccharomyces japonicus (strain yFS275 / FY16936) TaxID=402676 RepID=B6JWJ2_SCHJY|nr:condensin complex non-SMC subunit Cnd2 [Schizosaccharomyces japonicus yFS275]EEB05743.1 condensin complex non-SMC subunit Cnd2 [Schizosaccharomyces japonicus yFS275]
MGRASIGPKTPVHLTSLNDDALEKKRNKERLRKQQHLRRTSAINSITPRTSLTGRESIGSGSPGLNSPFGTPQKKAPLLANFEEWMKLATDNKINSTNTWNFALIDYFHDMSLLKDGDNINFQKASCTLDGCVKIYTSRVDSVATETGKLLSGLANNAQWKEIEDEHAMENDGEDKDELAGAKEKRERKRAHRAEQTLAKSFEALQAKRLDLEYTFDPLFKKMCADFDEGGAKGLLMNHLSVNLHGRIVFDSTDDMVLDEHDDDKTGSNEDKDGAMDEDKEVEEDVKEEEEEEEFNPIMMTDLKNIYFQRLDGLSVCPSLQGFEFGNNTSLNVSLLKSLGEEATSVDGPLVLDNADSQSGPPNLELDVSDDGDDDDAPLDFIGLAQDEEDTTLATAQHAIVDPQHAHPTLVGETTEEQQNQQDYSISSIYSSFNEVYGYFDKSLKHNWAGPELWRIQRLKQKALQDAENRTNSSSALDAASTNDTATSIVSVDKKRRKEVDYTIDFSEPINEESLFAPASANLQLPKNHWRTLNRNLLPDDYHIDSKRLLRLFLKDNALINARSNSSTTSQPEADVDPSTDVPADADNSLVLAHPGLDDGAMSDSDGAADAPLPFVPEGEEDNPFAMDSSKPPSSAGFGESLLLNARLAMPEMLQYAKRATRVDVKVLKERLYECLEIPPSSEEAPEPIVRRFTDVLDKLSAIYEPSAYKDVSTSFAFICVLHLANEHGLKITSSDDLNDLYIERDLSLEPLTT